MKKNIRLISIILTITLLSSYLVSCGVITPTHNDNKIDTDKIVSSITNDILDNIEDYTQNRNEESSANNPSDEILDELSYDPEEYEQWLYNFSLGLMINQLEYAYNVFDGNVVDSNGNYISGLAFFDYSDFYYNPENEDEIYIMCGFIPYMGEIEISEDDFNLGLIINTTDYSDYLMNGIRFVWKYRSDAVADHCVVDGQYMTYGVDKNGYFYYNVCEYSQEVCDTSLGSLYSYDSKKFLYDTDVGNYAILTGESLSVKIDYSQLEAEVNAIIANQDINFSTIQIESALNISYEAVCNFLASLNEETFMGYRACDLLEIAKQLDPKDCIEFSPSGILITEIAAPPPEDATAATKWLVGATCLVVAVAGTVAEYVLHSLAPVIGPMVAGTVSGIAMDIFMQVVLEGHALGELNWNRIAISAVSGAISGAIGCGLRSRLSGVSLFIADTLVDGVLGGAENLVLDLMEGKRGTELIESFGYGFVFATVVSAGLKGLGKGLETSIKGAGKLGKMIATAAPTFTKKVSNFAEKVSAPVTNAGNWIGSKIDDLKKIVDEKALAKAATKLGAGKSSQRVIQQILSDIDIRNESARRGAKKVFTYLGYDWDEIQRLRSNPEALEKYFNSILFKGKIKDITKVDQLMGIAQEKYMPDAKGFYKFSKGKTTTGDSLEWYEFLIGYDLGLNPTKEFEISLSKYHGISPGIFGLDEPITKVSRKIDLVTTDANGQIIYNELKVGLPKGSALTNIRAEHYADCLILKDNPNIIMNYRISSNGDNGAHMLLDPKQASYLVKMSELFPDRYKVYLNNQLLSLDDLRKYAFP